MIGCTFFLEGRFFWRENQKVILPMSMPHCDPSLSRLDARKILNEHDAYLIRWEIEFDCKAETEWWYIIKDTSESIDDLPKKTRYMIRKATAAFEARKCNKETILHYGYDIYCSAYSRYITHEKEYTEAEFLLAIEKLPDESEFWIVRNTTTGKYVAFSENLVRDSACFYVSMWLDPEAMKLYTGYLLFHEMNKYYLNERGLKYVSDGARSISHSTNIHGFLQSKFSFRKAYCRLNVIYVFWLKWMITVMFPFRFFIKYVPGALSKKMSILLEQERIRKASDVGR